MMFLLLAAIDTPPWLRRYAAAIALLILPPLLLFDVPVSI